MTDPLASTGASRRASSAGGFHLRIDPEAGRVVVAVRGELDSYTAPRLRECLADLVNRGEQQVVIDLGETAFIESRGIAVLVAAMKRLRADGGELHLRSPSRQAYRLFEITGLTKVMSLE